MKEGEWLRVREGWMDGWMDDKKNTCHDATMSQSTTEISNLPNNGCNHKAKETI